MSDEPQNNASSTHKSTVDKIIMGAIIGTAIGSAVGLTIAPKKGKDTREDVKNLSKETAGGLFRLGKAILRTLFKRSKSANATVEGTDNSGRMHQSMKQIPDEMEIIPPEHK